MKRNRVSLRQPRYGLAILEYETKATWVEIILERDAPMRFREDGLYVDSIPPRLSEMYQFALCINPAMDRESWWANKDAFRLWQRTGAD